MEKENRRPCGTVLLNRPSQPIGPHTQKNNYRSSSGCTHLYGVISCRSVSLIIRTGGDIGPYGTTGISATLPASISAYAWSADSSGSCVRDGWEQGLPVRNECPATSRPTPPCESNSSVEQASYVLRNALTEKTSPSN